MNPNEKLIPCPKCHAMIPSEDETWIKCNRCGYSYPETVREEDTKKKEGDKNAS